MASKKNFFEQKIKEATPGTYPTSDDITFINISPCVNLYQGIKSKLDRQTSQSAKGKIFVVHRVINHAPPPQKTENGRRPLTELLVRTTLAVIC